VGLVISSDISSPKANPLTKVVFPAPRVPCRAIIWPGNKDFASFLPMLIVVFAEFDDKEFSAVYRPFPI